MGNDKTKKIMIIGSIVLAAISIIVLGISFYLFSNPKTIMLQSMSHFKSNVKDMISETNNRYIDKLSKIDKGGYSTTMTLKANGKEMYSLSGSIIENKKDEKSAVNIMLMNGQEKLLNVSEILANNNVYMKIDELADYYYTSFDYISFFENTDMTISNKVMDYLYDSFDKVMNKKDIKKSSTTITLGEKEKKTIKLSYNITGEVSAKVLNETLDKIVKDKDLVSKIVKSLDISNDDFNKGIKSIREELDSIKDVEDVVTYNVYYYGFNNIVMYELETNGVSIKLYDYSDTNELVLTDDDIQLLDVKVTEKDGKYEISGKISDYAFNGTYTESKDKSNLKLNLIVQGLTVKLNIDTEYKEDEANTVISADVLGNKFEIDTNLKIVTDKDVDLDVIKNAKNVSDITEEDMQNILKDLEQNPLLSLVKNFIPNFDDDEPEIYDQYIVE